MSNNGKDFDIQKGATFLRTLIWKDENDTPIDLTGYSVRMHVRVKTNSETPFLELTTANGRAAINNPTLGEIILEVSHTDTSAIEQTYGVYDLEMVAPSGRVTNLLAGNIRIIEEITR